MRRIRKRHWPLEGLLLLILLFLCRCRLAEGLMRRGCGCVVIAGMGTDSLRPFAFQKMTSLQSAWNSLMQDAVHSSSCAALLSKGIPGISNGSLGMPNSSTAWYWSSSGLTR
ncbi:MAG: hypothetical protein JOS17DRAFT_457332 [Linnemannia elongata]|nr:MAG: hypothetical protein JOS17DRAFT_457332 [Linnemannia elongata]